MVYPSTKIINLCIEANIFSSVLRVAEIVSLFKNKGSRDNATNYTPISKLPIFVFEKILNDQNQMYLASNNFFYQSQFGFGNKISTTFASNILTSNILEGFKRGCDIYASFFNLTKAFHCV